MIAGLPSAADLGNNGPCGSGGLLPCDGGTGLKADQIAQDTAAAERLPFGGVMNSLALPVVLDEVGAALAADLQGEVQPGARARVLRALGDIDEQPGDGGPGHRRRVRLAVTAARRVAPLWAQASVPFDGPDPHRLLQAAQQVLDRLAAGDAGLARVRTRAGALLDDIDIIAGDLIGEPGEYVWAAAAGALVVALDDEPLLTGVMRMLGPDGQDLLDLPDLAGGLGTKLSNDDIDPDGWDTALCAAAAEAEAASGDDLVQRRRAFWRWWLDQAAAVAAAEEPHTATDGTGVIATADRQRQRRGRAAHYARQHTTDAAAVTAYEQVLADEPDNADACYGLGLARFRRGAGGAVDLLRRVPAGHGLAAAAAQLAALATLLDDAEAASPGRSQADPLLRTAAAHIRASRYEPAMQMLLHLVCTDRDDLARRTLVALFDHLGTDNPLVGQYRRRLATALF
jgi:thioredoxin-like negative regulator of GroEL